MKTVEEKAQEYAMEFVKSKYSDIYSVDAKFAFNAVKHDWLAGHAEAMRWRDPEVDPPTNKDVVLVKTDNNCYATAYYHGKASGFITYGEDAYVEFGEIIGWRPI